MAYSTSTAQSKITEGGILGLTLFLHHWTGISPGIFSFLLDMTCYIIGFKLLGTDFLKNAIFSTCCYALLYRFWEFTGPFLPSYADKPLIAAILGGLFVGIGAGLIVRRGGASGGDDALALILHQVTGWKISRSYFFTDFVVLMLSISYIPLRNIFFFPADSYAVICSYRAVAKEQTEYVGGGSRLRKQLEGLIFYLPSITIRYRNAMMSKWTKTPPECQLRGCFLLVFKLFQVFSD